MIVAATASLKQVVGSARSARTVKAVIAAQFFSSLADNALLIAAIGLLMERHAAAWTIPALRMFFYGSYVVLAAFAGAVADAFPKGRVILVTNISKLCGCGLLLANAHPLLAYGLIGLGAAAYSPAKYGILPELLPAGQLVRANAWMEVSTVMSILLGVALGSYLMDATKHIPQLADTPARSATVFLVAVYLAAVGCAAAITSSRASRPSALNEPRRLVIEFKQSLAMLWRDPESQISLAVTSLFWAASAVLQFVVLQWAQRTLHLPLAQAALLQAAAAIGMVVGALCAARWVPMHRVLKVLPLGLVLGLLLLLMLLVTQVGIAVLLLIAIGAAAGLFVVPMNALLQHRGQLLMHPGQSIAVQNFNESLASLVMLAVYGWLVSADLPLSLSIVGFGLFVSLAMLLIMARHRFLNARPGPARAGATAPG